MFRLCLGAKDRGQGVACLWRSEHGRSPKDAPILHIPDRLLDYNRLGQQAGAALDLVDDVFGRRPLLLAARCDELLHRSAAPA